MDLQTEVYSLDLAGACGQRYSTPDTPCVRRQPVCTLPIFAGLVFNMVFVAWVLACRHPTLAFHICWLALEIAVCFVRLILLILYNYSAAAGFGAQIHAYRFLRDARAALGRDRRLRSARQRAVRRLGRGDDRAAAGAVLHRRVVGGRGDALAHAAANPLLSLCDKRHRVASERHARLDDESRTGKRPPRLSRRARRAAEPRRPFATVRSRDPDV